MNHVELLDSQQFNIVSLSPLRREAFKKEMFSNRLRIMVNQYVSFPIHFPLGLEDIKNKSMNFPL